MWWKLKYQGLANGITRVLGAVNYESDQINLIVNTDGVPVFKSSDTKLWPILCMFGGFHPFLEAAFSGEKKPNDVNSFLRDFLQEYELLKKISLISNINVTQSIFVMDQLGNF